MNQFNPLQFITQLSAINHRQGAAETRAAKLIMRTLDRHGVRYRTESFITHIPKFVKAELWADDQSIPAIATSFVSGEITDKSAIISSMISSQRFIDDANINFNPYAQTISRSNHYFAPSLAVAPEWLSVICAATDVHGRVVVRKQRHQSLNIIVGNLTNPRTIALGHYDSIGPGVIDNASGTALLMDIAINHPDVLDRTALVIGGNEELSYDHPLYWGHGYRVFETKHLPIMRRARAIIGVDCVGHAPAILYDDVKTVRLGIPLANLNRWQRKAYLLSGDLGVLNPVYHSDADDGIHTPIQERYFAEARQVLLDKC